MASTVSGTHVALPAPPPGWYDCTYAILMDGTLAFLRSSIDMIEMFRAWREAVAAGSNKGYPHLDFTLRVSAFDGSRERHAIEAPGASYFPCIDRTASGQWIIADARVRLDDPKALNARIFAHDGIQTGAYRIGDGIEHVRCAPDGTTWVGYFDEGVFGDQDEDGNWPIGSNGIVQLDSSGRLLWGFNAQSSAAKKDGRPIIVDDCYAMALAGDVVWAATYTDFPICRIEKGVVRVWSTADGGYEALAVDGDLALLAGGYNEDKDRLLLMRLPHDHPSAEQVASYRFPRPSGQPFLLQGRGDTLHVVGDGMWKRITVASAKAAADR